MPTTPERRPTARPAPDRAILDPTKAFGPMLQVHTYGQAAFDVELATDPEAFLLPSKRGPGTFFTTRGRPNPAGTTGSPGAVPGTNFVYVTPDDADWAPFRDATRDPAERIHYRVLLRGPDASSTSAAHASVTDVEWEDAPFVLVERGETAKLVRAVEPDPKTMPVLPALRVSDDGLTVQTVEESTRVDLFGFHLSGLEYRWPHHGRRALAKDGCFPVPTGVRDAATLDDELVTLAERWKANTIRVGLNQDWLLRGGRPRPGTGDPAGQPSKPFRPLQYAADLDELVGLAARRGLYAIVTVQGSKLLARPGTTDEWELFKPHLPDALSVVLWAVLARRYARIPSVLFDLCTEPHVLGLQGEERFDRLYTGLRPGTKQEARGSGTVEVEDPAAWYVLWRDWVVHLLETMKANGGTEPVRRIKFVSSIERTDRFGWSSSLADPGRWPMKGADGKPLPDVVYSSHLYPQGWLRGATNADWAAIAKERAALLGIPDTGPPRCACFLGEWGPRVGVQPTRLPARLPPEDSRYVREMADQLVALVHNRRGLVGWAAWSWADDPQLVAVSKQTVRAGCQPAPTQPLDVWARTTAGGYAVTEWGELVEATLARHRRVPATRP